MKRARRSWVQTLEAPPERVFPFLCPVREREWAVGWSCDVIYSESGVAEDGCVFVTRRPGEPDRVWVITTHDPKALRVAFCTVTPGFLACRIHIQLAPAEGGRTHAEIRYEYTALTDAGNAFVDAFTDAAYEKFMQEWEAELNHFLQTGKMKS